MTVPTAEAIASSAIPPVAPDVFNFTPAGQPFLTGASCSSCDRRSFPWTARCPSCGVTTDRIDLGVRGVIYSYTTVRVHPPYGLPCPYSVALIDLEAAPLRIFGLLDPGATAPFHIGQAVTLGIAPIGDDGHGEPRLRPFFASAGGGAQ